MLRTALVAAAALLAAARAQNTAPINFRVEASADVFSAPATCISYSVPDGSLVQGLFRIANPLPGDLRAAVHVQEGGNQPFSKPDLSGEARFSFRSRPEAGAPGSATYDACVRVSPRRAAAVPPGTHVEVSLVLWWTSDLFDDDAARRNVLDPIQQDFFKLEAGIARLAGELNDYVRHEELHRSVNDGTLVRLRIVSVLAILALLALSVYQVEYLRRFFRAKKLI